jgi:L-threonylcarbamoyladenylate synthase
MKDKIEKAVDTLKRGGTILYPTDTIWGIGCDATNEEACQKIMEIKQRPEDKSFILLADSFRMIEQYIPDFATVVYDLVDLSVKPLTVIYPNAAGLAPSVLAADGSVGIRITKDPICLALIRGLRKPIVSTSANISGMATSDILDGIPKTIRKGVDFVVNERETEQLTVPSQIVKVDLNGSIKIIRE